MNQYRHLYITLLCLYCVVAGSFIPDRFASTVLITVIVFTLITFVFDLVASAIERNEGIRADRYESEIRSVQGDLSNEIRASGDDEKASDKAMQKSNLEEQTDFDIVSKSKKQQMIANGKELRKNLIFEVNK